MTGEAMRDPASVLAVENLSIALPEGGDRPFAVEQVSFAINRNEVVCLVGESGSGKSMIAHAILSLLPKGVDIVSGAVKVAGHDTATLDRGALRRLRGGKARDDLPGTAFIAQSAETRRRADRGDDRHASAPGAADGGHQGQGAGTADARSDCRTLPCSPTAIRSNSPAASASAS